MAAAVTESLPITHAVEVDNLHRDLAAARDEICELNNKLSAVTVENACLLQQVAQLEDNLNRLHTPGSMEVLRAACGKANREILGHSNTLVDNTGRRSLGRLVDSLSEGTVCRERSEFMTKMVQALTLIHKEASALPLTEAEANTQRRRQVHRLMAVEHVYCA